MFELDKWYFDLITDDGGAFVGYSAGLRWHRLHIGYESFLLAPATGPATEGSSLIGVRAPECSGPTISWSSNGLELSGTWERLDSPIQCRLREDDRGSVTWSCLQPRSRARVRLPDGRSLEGPGYAEQLRMTLSPGDLDFDTLHWGRFHGNEETLVWIEWQRGERGRWIFRNGLRQGQARLVEGGIRDLGDGAELRFGDFRTLRDRSVWPALASVPGLKERVVGRLANMHEVKWIGHGGLLAPGNAPADGWLIHEEVTWHGVP